MDSHRIRAWATSSLRSPVLWFGALSVLLLFVHEPWRDEAEHWLVVRDSPTLQAFFHAQQYLGTPILWHVLMAPLAQLGMPFLAVRILHSGLAFASVVVLWRFAPFRPGIKWLLCFGYFTAYEYNAIARSYVLIMLLLFSLAAADPTRRKHPVRYAMLLALLANAAVHGILIAGVLAGMYALEILRDVRRGAWTRGVTAGLAILVVGVILALLQLRPPADLDPVVATWLIPPHYWSISLATLGAFVPLPGSHLPLWNTLLLQPLPGPVKLALSLGIIALCAWLMRANRPAQVGYLVVTGALLALFVFRYYGYQHHAGLLFLAFVYFLWIATSRNLEAGKAKPAAEKSPSRMARLGAIALPSLLVLQVAGAAVFMVADTGGQFSAAPELAHYLDANGLTSDGTLIAIYQSFASHSVIAHLKDPHAQFYYPQADRFASFTTWDTQWRTTRNAYSLEQVLAHLDNVSSGHPRVLYIESENALYDNAGSEARARLTHFASFGQHIMGSDDERFDLYWVARK